VAEANRGASSASRPRNGLRRERNHRRLERRHRRGAERVRERARRRESAGALSVDIAAQQHRVQRGGDARRRDAPARDAHQDRLDRVGRERIRAVSISYAMTASAY
jgi:hypothetical protein